MVSAASLEGVTEEVLTEGDSVAGEEDVVLAGCVVAGCVVVEEDGREAVPAEAGGTAYDVRVGVGAEPTAGRRGASPSFGRVPGSIVAISSRTRAR